MSIYTIQTSEYKKRRFEGLPDDATGLKIILQHTDDTDHRPLLVDMMKNLPPHILRLDFSDCVIGSGTEPATDPGHFIHIMRAINTSKVENINMDNCSLGNLDPDLLGIAFNQTNLTSVSLCGNDFDYTEEEVTTLAGCLQGADSLLEIKLGEEPADNMLEKALSSSRARLVMRG